MFLKTVLVEAGRDYWHRPITDFVPELVEAAESCSAEVDSLTCPDWNEITLGTLASHLAGLGRGRPVTPAPPAIGGVSVTSFGLPPKPVIELAQCEKRPCTRAEFHTGIPPRSACGGCLQHPNLLQRRILDPDVCSGGHHQ